MNAMCSLYGYIAVIEINGVSTAFINSNVISEALLEAGDLNEKALLDAMIGEAMENHGRAKLDDDSWRS